MTQDPNSVPLHTMQPLTRFSERALAYAHYRPRYPLAAIAALLADFAPLTERLAADVGAGTGISSRLLADQGLRVWAIEPNLEMQQAAEPHPGVTFRTATAEHTGLPDASVDLVTCFQAFHWFQPEASLAEFHRILKPAGRLALVWNDRDRSDPFTAHYSQVIQSASNHHPAENRRSLQVSTQALVSSPLYRNSHHQTFAYAQMLDFEALLGRAQSTSYLPQTGPAYDELVLQLQQLYEQWADATGQVQLRYCTQVTVAEPIVLGLTP